MARLKRLDHSECEAAADDLVRLFHLRATPEDRADLARAVAAFDAKLTDIVETNRRATRWSVGRTLLYVLALGALLSIF